MSVSSSVRPRGGSTRASTSRSKLGCKTCKIRRVKCGEEKPHCLRCTSTGRKCDYESANSRSTISFVFENPLSLSPNTVWRERRAFAYYFQHTATSIGGGLDIDFWRTIVPQVCRSEPAVWDAMISISSLFESPDPYPDLVPLRRDHPHKLNQNQRDALSWYSRSVSAVRQGLERGGVGVFTGLITCVLFICVEALLGDMDESLHLYNQGVHLIHALRDRKDCGAMTATESSLLEDTIVPIFIRLGAVTLHSLADPMSTLLRETECDFTQEVIFVSLKSAREAIVLLSAEIHRFEQVCEQELEKSHAPHISPRLMVRQRTLSVKLQRWHAAFTRLTASPFKNEQFSTCALLLAYHEMLFVMLGVCHSPSRITTDVYTPNFQNMIENSIIALNGSARPDGSQPPFTFEISVGLPLFFTCVRCRDPKLRRTAIAMLRKAHRVLGLHNRDQGIILIEAVVMIEENNGRAIDQAQTPSSFETAIANDTPGTPINNREISDATTPITSLVAGPYPTPPDTESKAAEVLVPQEARIKPLGVFRPRDGYPHSMRKEDLEMCSQRFDDLFFRFSWNEYNQIDDTWRTVYGCLPVEL
ncbi:uncharacterized protein N7511_000937 [Penicillium nucicola]|uniref:uncharacterized protein n=1 Tax=Penicillium nucicola TaxID=1850975 RepID=UPI002544DDAC|nr:uncharacterized protein N7511_000937 [Penicillium nucicola]KAJ5775926.1 hypothetical protein N7511_000937 [Penicillium nucicola]